MSARPVATWFVKRYCVNTPKIIDTTAPPTAAPINPSVVDSVSCAAINPITAPVIIMPSTPRFKTPARSTTNSPIAANKIGVEATIIALAKRIGLISMVTPPDGPRNAADNWLRHQQRAAKKAASLERSGLWQTVCSSPPLPRCRPHRSAPSTNLPIKYPQDASAPKTRQ